MHKEKKKPYQTTIFDFLEEKNMNLNDFISHIKHRSLGIDIFGTNSCKQYFFGDVGTYTTSLIKNEIGGWRVNKIEPLANSLNIFLED